MSREVAPTMRFGQRLDAAPRFYVETTRGYGRLSPVTRPLVSVFHL
jgi:hypothetical protein